MGRSKLQKGLNALAVGFVSVCIPWVIGTRFLSAFTLIPLACLSVFLVADLTIDSHTGDDQEVGPRAFACVLVGWSFGMTILIMGTGALNALNWSGRLLLPRAEILADAAGLSLGACVLAAGVAWQVTGKASPGAARLIMKLAIVLVTVVSIYGCNKWQTDGTFVLTTRTISWISGFAASGMFVMGVGLLALPGNSLKE